MKTKTTLSSISALLMLLASTALCFISLFMPPEGEIDRTVLWFTAQSLFYAGATFGLSEYVRTHLGHDRDKADQ